MYWDSGFPGGVPRQYYKSYGLSASGLLTWLQKQISSTAVFSPICRLGQFACNAAVGVFAYGQQSVVCLNEEEVCNGVWNCADGSDEQMCAPATRSGDAEATATSRGASTESAADSGNDGYFAREEGSVSKPSYSSHGKQ